MEKKFANMIQVSAKGSIILIVGQMGSTLVSAIGTILVARMLGNISFGVISIAQIPVTVCLLLINNGVDKAIINYIAVYREEGKQAEIKSIIKAGFIVNFGIGLFTTIALYLLSGYLANQVYKQAELELLIRILSVSVLAQSILNTSFAVFVGYEQMIRRSLLSIIYALMKSVLGPLLIFMGFGTLGAAYGTIFPLLIVSSLGLIFVVFSMRNLSSDSSNMHHINLIVRYAYPLFISNILSGSMNQVFSFILPIYVAVAVISDYSAATTFSVLINFFMTPVNTATFPLLSKLKPRDQVFEYVYHSILKYESLIVFPIASFIIVLSNQLVLILYGESYVNTALFLRIYMINYYFIGLGSSAAINLLNSQKQTKINFQSTLIQLFVGIPLGLILIPRYGVIGFLITTIFAPKIGLLYSIWWIKRNYNLSPELGVFIKILLASVTSGLICYGVSVALSLNPGLEFVICGIVYVLCYILAVFFTGAITKRNLMDIYSLVERNNKIKSLVDPIYNVLIRISRE